MRWAGHVAPYGGAERHIQGFGGETRGKETTWLTQVWMGYNIKMDLQEVECGGTDWIVLVQDSDRLQGECSNEPSCSIKCGEFLD